MTDREKIDKFIARIRKTKRILFAWWAAAIILLIVELYIYDGRAPQPMHDIISTVVLSVIAPWLAMTLSKIRCPVCGGYVLKYKNSFHKICPHCHTDIDPDCVFHHFDRGLSEDIKQLEIKKEK